MQILWDMLDGENDGEAIQVDALNILTFMHKYGTQIDSIRAFYDFWIGEYPQYAGDQDFCLLFADWEVLELDECGDISAASIAQSAKKTATQKARNTEAQILAVPREVTQTTGPLIEKTATVRGSGTEAPLPSKTNQPKQATTAAQAKPAEPDSEYPVLEYLDVVSGEIEDRSDFDGYLFYGEKGDKIWILVDARDGDMEPLIDLREYDTENFVAKGTSGDDVHAASIMNEVLDKSGYYLIKISATRNPDVYEMQFGLHDDSAASQPSKTPAGSSACEGKTCDEHWECDCCLSNGYDVAACLNGKCVCCNDSTCKAWCKANGYEDGLCLSASSGGKYPDGCHCEE